PQTLNTGPQIEYHPGDGVEFHGFPPGPPPGPPSELKRVTLPTYVIGVTDMLQIDSLEGLKTQPVHGPHLVRPDGTVGLGIYGEAYVAGQTIDQARVSIAQAIVSKLRREPGPKGETGKTLKDVYDGLSVDVLAYNSKVYYVITDGAGYGD